MRTIGRHITTLFRVIFGGFYFPRCIYIKEVICIDDYHTSVNQGLIFTLNLAAFPVNEELSTLEISVKQNSDQKYVDLSVTDRKMGVERVNHLGTIKKYQNHDLTFSFIHKLLDKRMDISTVVVQVCPDSHYNPSSLQYLMPTGRVGYKF
jgi:hypothetical protein